MRRTSPGSLGPLRLGLSVLIAAAAAVAVAASPASMAQAGSGYTYTEEFRGLQSVEVAADVYVGEGLDVSSEDLEALLVDVAYNVLTENLPDSIFVTDEESDDPSAALVSVRVNLFQRSDGGFFGSLDLCVDRFVRLYPLQKGGQTFLATVYQGGYSFTGADPTDLEATLEGDLRDLLSDLISTLDEAWPSP